MLSELNGIGFAPFGIESMVSDLNFAQSNLVLKELLPLISEKQGRNKMRGFLQQESKDTASIDLGNYRINVKYNSQEIKSFGLVVKTGEDELFIAGMDCQITISSVDAKKVKIGAIEEGRFEKGKWQMIRQLNGDETWHNAAVLVGSRSYSFTSHNGLKTITETLAPIPVLNQPLEANFQTTQVKAPAIYKVKMYSLD